ncbi:MAG: flagellar hook-basal body complex protein FliE [Gammaproteobacteria bacterium SHHR-1]|uniref:flagellar hook-basal body complex protein FliE n=1 Tax=Magnetovirga frankeli TaxID=947516 RepID=UPI001293C8E1|nr:flagellar hook-basal body complex protein FliE [gamma proteobacterium SS-5]
MSIGSIDQMTAQMRLMAAQAGGVQGLASEPVAPGNQTSAFGEMLKNSIDKVNELQGTGNAMAKAFELGSEEYSLAEVMIAKQKASVAMQATVQVRNKFMEAYKEVMRMSL